MRATEDSSLRTLGAIREFLTRNAAAVPEAAASGTRAELDQTFAMLTDNVTNQVQGALSARGSTASYHALREALLAEHMAAITRIARLRQREIPQLRALRMPRGEPSRENLVQFALGLGVAALPFSQVFIKAGLPQDFIADLRAAVDAMSEAALGRDASLRDSLAATAGLRARLVEARKQVKVLDSLVRRDIKDDATLLGEWESVSHVRKPRRRKRPGDASGSTPEAAP